METKVYKRHFWLIDVNFYECERCGLKKRERFEVTKSLRKGAKIIEVYNEETKKWERVEHLSDCLGTKSVKYAVN